MGSTMGWDLLLLGTSCEMYDLHCTAAALAVLKSGHVVKRL
jgi:hypothetical protein